MRSLHSAATAETATADAVTGFSCIGSTWHATCGVAVAASDVSHIGTDAIAASADVWSIYASGVSVAFGTSWLTVVAIAGSVCSDVDWW